MASESIPPPIPGSKSSNLVYGLVGVGLIGAAAALWFGMKGCGPESAPPTAQAALDAGAPVQRGGALVDDALFIPDPEPEVADAGAPAEEDAGQRVRYVTRYVGGGGGGGNWDCAGAVPEAAARAQLAERNREFRNCYERRLKVNHTIEGRVNVRMRVGRGGEVSAVSVSGTLSDNEVLSCVRGIAQRLRFPPPTGGTCAVVAAPFNFTPRQ